MLAQMIWCTTRETNKENAMSSKTKNWNRRPGETGYMPKSAKEVSRKMRARRMARRKTAQRWYIELTAK